MDVFSSVRHVPVLLSSVLEWAGVKPGMRVVDATLGAGGYTRALLQQVGSTGAVMAFDWDQSAIDRFRREAEIAQAIEAGRLHLIARPYSHLVEALDLAQWPSVDVVVADLGLSSLQLNDPSRGLSFQFDGPLDMRLNSAETVTAADIVNGWSEESLAELFRTYADEGEAERIAEAICLARRHAPLVRTTELAELVKNNVVGARRRGRIHPATQVFQALRMAVNSERAHLIALLQQAFDRLKPGGRLLVVSFHSGEDALIKHTFRQWNAEGRGKLLTKKPVVPSQSEITSNPRSRSARLRGIEKTMRE